MRHYEAHFGKLAKSVCVRVRVRVDRCTEAAYRAKGKGERRKRRARSCKRRRKRALLHEWKLALVAVPVLVCA